VNIVPEEDKYKPLTFSTFGLDYPAETQDDAGSVDVTLPPSVVEEGFSQSTSSQIRSIFAAFANDNPFPSGQIAQGVNKSFYLNVLKL